MGVLSRLVAVASQTFPKLSSRILASSGYTLDLGRFGPDAFGVWTKRTAERQERAWRPIVAAAKSGSPREDVVALWAALDDLPAAPARLLEVGCGGGYNSELVVHRVPGAAYTGLDRSAPMITIAAEHYPSREFVVGSAYELPFEEGSFDVVLDGVALLHMPEWERSIAEYARVASGHVILHGLTLTDRPTTTFAKYAYGQPSIELVMNRAEVLDRCTERGLRLVSSHPGLDYDLEDTLGIRSVSETWLLAKRSARPEPHSRSRSRDR